MNKLMVVGDPNNVKSCSSEIIISNLNKGLQALDFYSDNGIKVVYDCLGQNHGYDSEYIICPYETSIPRNVIYNAAGRNLIGVSFQNQSFFVDGGYPMERTRTMLLGVDSKVWNPGKRTRTSTSPFRFGMMCDSNTRAAYIELIVAFGAAFYNRKDVELYIKDRWATDKFKLLVASLAERNRISIIYDDTHVTEKDKEVEFYRNLDCHIFLNRTSTFALTVAQGMAVGLPTIVIDYSGPRDYCNRLNSCLIEYYMEDITPSIVSQLVEYGYRNYLLVNPELFDKKPRWAQPIVTSIRDCLIKVFENKEYRDDIAYNGLTTAKSMTWERSAASLACIVNT